MNQQLLPSPKKLGEALLKEAQRELVNDQKKQMIDAVKREIVQLEHHKRQLAQLEEIIPWYERRIEALHSGKFTVNRFGKIEFSDSELNQELRQYIKSKGYDL